MWHPLCRAVGLHLRGESNLIPPDEPGWRELRVPDLVVFPEAARAERGVGEVLIIHRDTKAVRHWARDGARLEEQEPDASGAHRLRCLPTSLWTEAGVLVVDADGSVARI